MDKNKVNSFLLMYRDHFNRKDLITMKQKLEQLDDSMFFSIQSIPFEDPTTILLIAFLGLERFWLDKIGLGILKIITFGGCGIWWLVDIFTAKNRTKKYNFKQFLKITIC